MGVLKNRRRGAHAAFETFLDLFKLTGGNSHDTIVPQASTLQRNLFTSRPLPPCPTRLRQGGDVLSTWRIPGRRRDSKTGCPRRPAAKARGRKWRGRQRRIPPGKRQTGLCTNPVLLGAR